MSLRDNARSAKAWFERESQKLTKFARWLDLQAVARAVKRRLRERR